MVNELLNIESSTNDTFKREEGDSRMQRNAESLDREMDWFTAVVNQRLSEYFSQQANTSKALEDILKETDEGQKEQHLSPPDLRTDTSVYAEFIKYYGLTSEERLLLLLALTPHVQPHLLDIFFALNPKTGRGYTEFGGIKGERHGGFLPTIETALFLLAGNDLVKRFQISKFFDPNHIFMAHGILIPVKENNASEPFYSNVMSLSDEYVDFFTTGKLRKPLFSTDFPAKILTTGMDWGDLILDEHTAKQLDEIKIWLDYGSIFLNEWGMAAKIKPGYKTLFYGSPGTGKTLTAALLGKLFHLDVYRIDLSMVVSKYIGETEKNLEKVFSKAENKNWILFFDEADALFGKRTGIADAHDKYANQEIAYLLQRLEDYPGLVILASNMRHNVDEAFTRRLQSVIYFKKPQAKERFILWKNSFSEQCEMPNDEALRQLAEQYEITGGGIVNAVQYASLMALSRHEQKIALEDVITGVKKEFSKEGKTL